MSRHHRRIGTRRAALLRALVLERDGYRCRECGKAGRLEADHVQPLDKGGADDPDNMQALCVRCHIEKTRAERYGPVDPEVAAWAALMQPDRS